MRSDGCTKPVIIEEQNEYILVRDDHIPGDSKENIVLKPHGIDIIANAYFRKYGIVILACHLFLKINELAQHVCHFLVSAKTRFPGARKIGFIFISSDDPDDIFGHALPMMWEKEGAREHLFFLDTTQYLGETDEHRIKQNVQAFRHQLLSSMPHLKLWSIFGRRQIDYSSCYTDALVMLKDALLLPSLKAIVERKIKEACVDLTIFYAPEVLLRTAQVVSYLQRSHADLTHVICEHRAVFQKPSKTLGMFREQFDVSVEVNGVPKKFGTFTLFKARKYVADIENRKLAKEMVAGVFQRLFL